MIEFKGKKKASKLRIYEMLEKHGQLSTLEIYLQLKKLGKRIQMSMPTLCSTMAKTSHFQKIDFVDYNDAVFSLNDYGYKTKMLNKRNRYAVWELKK